MSGIFDDIDLPSMEEVASVSKFINEDFVMKSNDIIDCLTKVKTYYERYEATPPDEEIGVLIEKLTHMTEFVKTYKLINDRYSYLVKLKDREESIKANVETDPIINRNRKK